MTTHTWNNAVALRDPLSGREHSIGTVEQAAEALRSQWPETAGSQRDRANEVFRQAIDNEADAESARRAFIAAAIEAHFAIH